jgi:hypothetical protein
VTEKQPLAGGSSLYFHLFGYLRRVIDRDTAVPDGTLQLAVAKAQLGALAFVVRREQRSFCAPQRMSPVDRRIEADRLDRAVDNSCVPARRALAR